jgi:hypothetical protein
VCFKTLIYCGQLCDNAVNYPSTPLKIRTGRTRRRTQKNVRMMNVININK